MGRLTSSGARLSRSAAAPSPPSESGFRRLLRSAAALLLFAGALLAGLTHQAQAQSAPAQVTGVHVLGEGGRLRVAWNAVTGATSYKVQWKSGTQSYNTSSRQATATEASHVITGLTAGTTYTVRVIAVNANGDGPPSTEHTGTPLELLIFNPTSLTITEGAGSLDLQWDVPNEDLGEVDSYKVQWKSGTQSYSSTREAIVTGWNTDTYTITGLTVGTEYTVRVIGRLDGVDGPTEIEHGFVPYGEGTGTPQPAPGVTLTALTPSPVPEGGSATYTVVLDLSPFSNVVIRVSRASGGSADVTFDTNSGTMGNQDTLTFTPVNWDTAQTVTVSAAEDADAADDTATLDHAVVAASSDNTYDSVTIASVGVTVQDDDTPGVTLTALTPSPVPEGGTATYTVKLDTLPASDVVIRVAKASGGSADVTFDTDADTENDQDTLTFTSSNWNTAQTVTVSAAEDTDLDDDTATLTHTVVAASSDDTYDSVTIASVSVTVDDAGDVTPPTLSTATVNGATLVLTYNEALDPNSVPEATRDSFWVWVGGVTRDLADTDPVVISGSTVTLTLASAVTAGQTVTLSYAIAELPDDPIQDLAGNTAARISAPQTMSNVTPGILLSQTSLTVAEGDSATYTVRLNAQPSADVTVTVARGRGRQHGRDLRHGRRNGRRPGHPDLHRRRLRQLEHGADRHRERRRGHRLGRRHGDPHAHGERGGLRLADR